MTRIVVDAPVTTARDGGRRRLTCRVTGPGLPDSIWVEVADRDADLLCDRGDWAAVALLYPAMRMAAELRVEAPVSPRLLDAVANDLQPFLRVFDPALRRVGVTAAASAFDAAGGPLVATGFSAGIDSFATLARYRFAAVHPSLAVTALVVFDVGAFGKRSEPHFSRSVSRAESFAAAHGLRAIAVATNFDHVYRSPVVGRPGFEKTNTFRNAAAALALSKGIGRYYVSSSFAPAEIGVRPSYNPSYLDPLLLPLLSTERIELVSSCAGLTRIEKTRLVAALEEARPLLDVCTRVWERGDGRPLNCSHCGKCVRTLFTLEAIGRLESFSAVFDLDAFRRGRDSLLAKLRESAATGNSLDAEVVALMGMEPSRARAKGLLGRLRRFLAR
jgi:hypothetical protein